MAFVELSGSYWGAGPDLRSWHVTPTPDGWRLAFFEVEDEEPVLVGTFPTAGEAKHEAEAVLGAAQ